MRYLTYVLLLAGCLPGGAPAARAQTPPPFATGADISWVTELEASGYKFYNRAGAPQELFQLLRDDYELNTVRLRVWVNPPGGYNNAADVLAKARRAHALGQRLLLNFHYSDTWADPGQQTKPVAWRNYSLAQLQQAVYDHTASVLNLLKANGITPEWVQVGNETNDGMLWPEGRLTVNGFGNFAALFNQGAAAVKAVCPSALVVAHVSNGYDNGLSRYFFDGLRASGARWDVAGLSLYPDGGTWPGFLAQADTNLRDLVARYPGKPVLVVEAGMLRTLPVPTREMLRRLTAQVQALPGGAGLGVLYWEPEAYNWQGYTLGAWGLDARATVALDGFRPASPPTGPVRNPGFEFTAATALPFGWATTGEAEADYTEAGGHGGLFRLTHYRATAYQVTTSQTLTGLPNGTYFVRGWVKSGGGQPTCQLYLQADGAEQVAAVPTAASWVALQTPVVAVRNGQCEIGLRSVAGAGQYASLDDVELVSTPLAARPTAPTAAPPAPGLYPNPGTDEVTLSFALSRPGPVRVLLYAATGRLVRELATLAAAPAGPQALPLRLPPGLPPGHYQVQLSSGPQRLSFRLTRP